MSNIRYFCVFGLLSLLCATGGCIQTEATNHLKPFEAEQLESCLAIVVDMSGSFDHEWEERAHPLLLDLMDQFFIEALGGESRVVLCQMSGNEDVVLFEGSPSDLRQQFPTPTALADFLTQKSDPGGSPIYRTTDRAISYVASMPAVGEKTRLMTVILSDLEETAAYGQPRTDAGLKMLTTLRRYQRMGGGLALYFVSEAEQPRWQKILAAAGFEPGSYVIENHLVAKPRLPQFD